MGLQAHPCGNKRPFEELEEPAAGNGRTQQQPQQQQNHNHYHQPLEDCSSSARSAKQQCTIRVGLEAPVVTATSVLSSTPSCNDSSETIPEINNAAVTWYRDVQHQQSQTPDYDAYVNGFNAAEARASTPFTSSTSVYYSASSSATNNSESGLVPVPEYSHPLLPAFTGGNGAGCQANEAYSSVNVYQNLSSMQPVVLNGESLADRFERVCSSPRPYVQQYSANGRDVVDGAGYNYASESAKTTDERYWTFGYSSHCPKKATTSTTSTSGGGGNYAKCSSYGYDSSGFSGNKSGVVVCQQTENGQKIQRDENGKSYLELGANAVSGAVQPEWRPTWPTSGNNTCHSNQQLHHNAPVPQTHVKSCSKCGNVLTNGGQQQQPCYKHQRLSVLSLSMHKLNRYRQCSDPSLHRSVLICNTLRCIEDEMEREGLTGNAATTTEQLPTTSPAGVASNCDTCCCSHCGTVLTPSSSSSNNASAPEAPPQAHYTNINNNMPPNNYELHSPSTDPNFATCNTSTTPVSNTSITVSTATMTTINNNNNNISSSGGEMDTSKTSPSNADEDDSGFGDEDSRDIDWSSVFSMSTTSGFDVTSSSSINSTSVAAHHNTTNQYTYDAPSLFTASSSSGLQNESAHWKNSNSCNNTSSWSTSDAGDFSTFRWKSEMGDELDPGFVTHIMVGS